MSRYRFSPTAKQDLKEINRYLIRFRIPAARKLKEKIRQACERLAKFPEMGKRADELQTELRSFPVENYLIFYRPIATELRLVEFSAAIEILKRSFQKKIS